MLSCIAPMKRESTSAVSEEAFVSTLGKLPRPFRSVAQVESAMRRLLEEGLAELPFPGGGDTPGRWRALAAAGAFDLSLAKIYEGHTDALAIVAELGGKKWDGLWAVWAAEPPRARVTFHRGELNGRKQWCSGAAVMDHAVVSAWTEADEPVLAQISLRQSGVKVERGDWHAVGMAASESESVVFDRAIAEALGKPGDYVARPGFWQGGAGIAAVWFGGAIAIAQTLARSSRVTDDPHAAAHLGAIDSALRGARALLAETAAWMDANPRADACPAALRVRENVEAAANEVLLRTGRALGPGPLCGDAIHAQRCADLAVFLRQSHAEHDLAALGRKVGGDSDSWKL